jgi:hypothetical protein
MDGKCKYKTVENTCGRDIGKEKKKKSSLTPPRKSDRDRVRKIESSRILILLNTVLFLSDSSPNPPTNHLWLLIDCKLNAVHV